MLFCFISVSLHRVQQSSAMMGNMGPRGNTGLVYNIIIIIIINRWHYRNFVKSLYLHVCKAPIYV